MAETLIVLQVATGITYMVYGNKAKKNRTNPKKFKNFTLISNCARYIMYSMFFIYMGANLLKN